MSLNPIECNFIDGIILAKVWLEGAQLAGDETMIPVYQRVLDCVVKDYELWKNNERVLNEYEKEKNAA